MYKLRLTMDHINRKHSVEGTPIKIFATSKGIKAIQSPVRVNILSMLKERPLTFDDIVSHSGRAKSTISVHLKGMIKDGIIGSMPDGEDGRKKIFFINSNYLGDLSYRDKLEIDLKKYIARYYASNNDPFEFYRLMFRTVRVSLMREGINIDPVLHEAGSELGYTLFESLADPDMDKMIGNIARFWKLHGLGRIEVLGFDPLDVCVYDCFECNGLPYTGKPACAFDSGIFESIFSRYYGRRHTAEEIECYAMGNDRCHFIIKKESM